MQKRTTESGVNVSDHILMMFDPEFSKINTRVDHGIVIKGETSLEHEIAHAKAAYEAGQKAVYIVVPFVRIDDGEGGGKDRLITRRARPILEKNFGTKADIEIGIAPRFPSYEDSRTVDRILKSMDDPLNPLWDMYIKHRNGLPKLDGMVLTYEEMLQVLHDKWKTVRHL